MSASSERRSGQDRRQLDLPPPGDKERRRLVESRKSTIVEMTISDDEWASYFGNVGRPAGPAEKPGSAEEADAAAVFERARD